MVQNPAVPRTIGTTCILSDCCKDARQPSDGIHAVACIGHEYAQLCKAASAQRSSLLMILGTLYRLKQHAHNEGKQVRCKGTYTHKLEGGHRVPRAAAIWLIGCGICRGDGGCAFSIQVEDMHGALVTRDCQIVGWVPSREGNAENPGRVCSPSKLLAQ